jgi:hypothetical protein
MKDQLQLDIGREETDVVVLIISEVRDSAIAYKKRHKA